MDIRKLVFFISLMYSSTSFACSCGISPFEYTAQESPYLVHVKIVKSLSEYDVYWDKEYDEEPDKEKLKELRDSFSDSVTTVIAKLIKPIKGEATTESIMLSNWMCPTSIYISDLIPGNEYILALKKEEDRRTDFLNKQLNRNDDAFYLQPCTEPAALLKGNKIFYYKYCRNGKCLQGDDNGVNPEYFMDYDNFNKKYGAD